MEDPNPTLMVVDDDRLVLATLVAGLKQAGFDVIEADNGDDGGNKPPNPRPPGR
jgi:response regulator NasT